MITLLPRRPLLLLALVPGVMLLASSFVQLAASLVVVAVLLVIAAVVADLRLSARPAQLQLSRSYDPLLSIGVENTVTVTVSNLSPRRLRMTVRDEAPGPFETQPLIMHGSVAPWGELELRYTVTPFRRGEYEFGDINLRYQTPLGLMERQMCAAAAERARVYPNIIELRKHTLSNRGSDEAFQRARFAGGTEFERLREYTPDDEFRRIDWKATARLSKPVVRQLQVEQNQNILLMYDLGRQMTSPYGRLLKLDYAINSGVVLGYVAAQREERLGVLLFQDGVRSYLPPQTGMQQFRRVLEELYNAQPALIEPDYEAAGVYVARRLSQRSLCVIFTDVVDWAGAQSLLRGVGLFQPRHLPMVVLLMDPEIEAYAEEDPPDAAALYRAAVAQRLIDERRAMTRALEARGVIVVDVPASRLSTVLLDQYLQLKSRALL